NAYVTGFTFSTNFPTHTPYQASNTSGGEDAFVSKIAATGSALTYSTYLGGTSGVDQGSAITVDSSGAAYITGSTYSTNFPTHNPQQATYGGTGDAFVTKFDPTGATLVYSTYLGGSGSDGGSGIAVDSGGDSYVTGGTTSTNFPLTNPLQSMLHGSGGN